MSRLAIILCFIPRVIYGTYTAVQRETYAEHISRQSRSNLPTLLDGNVYRQFDKPGRFSAIRLPNMDPYTVQNNFGPSSFETVKREPPIQYEEIMRPYTTPSTLKSDIDYALAKSAADSRLESSKITSETMINKLKSLMHYQPPPEMTNENVGSYDGSNYYHMDDDDIRSSRILYDNWPYFYHSPYEYEHNKDILDRQKAKDKRFVANELESVIPVNEIIENDIPQTYTPKYIRDVGDNPVSGDAPFFSFVLNDYYERSGEDDPLSFKGIGLDWGSEFDHNNYLPGGSEEMRKTVRVGNSYYSTMRPVTVNHDSYRKGSESESATESNSRRDHEFNKNENVANRNSNYNTGYEGNGKQYNGFRDFLDSFANKFGSQNVNNNIDLVRTTDKDKGENKTGFHRVYHKDEYQEDKHFFDNNKINVKGLEKSNANTNMGGSEAYLRSQGAAAAANKMKAANNAGYANEETFESNHKAHDILNKLENKLNKYRTVAKQAANSNNADYTDQFKK